jgi:hypothetical protein
MPKSKKASNPRYGLLIAEACKVLLGYVLIIRLGKLRRSHDKPNLRHSPAVSLLLETARKGLKTRRRRGSHNEMVEGVLLQAFIMFLETR